MCSRPASNEPLVCGFRERTRHPTGPGAGPGVISRHRVESGPPRRTGRVSFSRVGGVPRRGSWVPGTVADWGLRQRYLWPSGVSLVSLFFLRGSTTPDPPPPRPGPGDGPRWRWRRRCLVRDEPHPASRDGSAVEEEEGEGPSASPGSLSHRGGVRCGGSGAESWVGEGSGSEGASRARRFRSPLPWVGSR